MNKHICACSMFLLLACVSLRASEPPSEPPPGTPEAMVAALHGGSPEPSVDPADIVKQPLGSPENPVRVGGPKGERAYLARLRCADGSAPAFEREGSTGKGPWGYILDACSVICTSGQKATVFMDMYHSDHHENGAVPGFTIEPTAQS